MPSSLTALATTSTEVPEKPACLNDGTECAPGTPVAIKVNATEVYNFYVISDEDNEVTLIMDRNIYVSGSTTDVNVVWYADSADNSHGPTTAVTTLKERTNGWNNIPERVYTYSDDGGGNMYSSFTETMRARMLTKTEASALKTVNNDRIPSWLYVNLKEKGDNNTWGYWLSTADGNYSDSAISMYYIGNFSRTNVTDSRYIGLRPVITLTK